MALPNGDRRGALVWREKVLVNKGFPIPCIWLLLPTEKIAKWRHGGLRDRESGVSLDLKRIEALAYVTFEGFGVNWTSSANHTTMSSRP